MATGKERSEDRRKQILDAAEKVFNRMGFARARMDDIVQEAGLSKGALYWYYKSKDALIRALLDRVFAGEMRQAEELVEADGSARERLTLFTRRAIAEIRRFETLMPLGYEFVALAGRRKSVRSVLKSYYKRYHGMLKQILEQGVASGEFAAIDTDSVAMAFIGMVEGLALLWFVAPDWLDWDVIGDQPLDLILNGILDRSG